MRGDRITSEAEWHSLSHRREELEHWLSRLKVELDTKDEVSELRERFDSAAREFQEIARLMAH